MKRKQVFNTTKIPRMTTVFPQAVTAGDFIFISGTTGVDQSTGKLSERFDEQVRQAFVNIKTILEEMQSSMDKVVKITVFMVAGNDFSVLNNVYLAFFPENAPARTTPQVMPFPAGILLSVECIALV